MGHCITVEKLGIPTTPLVTRAFHELAIGNATKRGMPHARITFTPHPVASKTPEELRAYVEGKEPFTGEPFMATIVGALTKPLTAEERATGPMKVASGPERYGPDTPDHLQQFYLDNGMTDYLPVIIPTEEQVTAMLAGTRRKPDEIVGRMAAGAYEPWEYTVRQVAINAVMAGCRPEYLPVLLAIASSGTPSLMSSTNSFAYAAVINGPIRDRLEMNYGIGALGPFAQANATIGRAWTLISKNLGNGGIPGDTYLGSLGNNLNYNNLIIAENEEASPWSPLSVQKGFKAGDNVVTLFQGLGMVPGQGAKGGALWDGHHEKQISDIFKIFTGLFGAFAVLDPLVAQDLKKNGFDTKEQLIDWLFENTRQTVADYKGRHFYDGFDLPRALNGIEPFVSWSKLPDDALVPYWPSKDFIHVVVTGGQTNAFFQAGNLRHVRSISIDQWL
ncbi:MAG: hypothetical protein IT494_09755 [Gammaproteobacteria bacterium]|nr:hypothetical protein [Gammaproteobacteria bacterium]